MSLAALARHRGGDSESLSGFTLSACWAYCSPQKRDQHVLLSQAELRSYADESTHHWQPLWNACSHQKRRRVLGLPFHGILRVRSGAGGFGGQALQDGREGREHRGAKYRCEELFVCHWRCAGDGCLVQAAIGPGRAAATRSGGGGDLPSPNPLDGFRFGALNPVLTDQGLHGLLGAFRCLISWSLSLHWRAWRAPTFLGVRDHLSPFQGVRSGTLTVRDIQGLRGGVRVCVYLTPVARDTILQFYSILLYIAPQEGSGPLSLTAQRRQ